MLDALRKKSDFYRCFKDSATLIESEENCRIYSFEYNGNRFLIKKTLRKANKRVIVTCSGHTVSAVRLIPVTIHTPATEEEFNIDVAEIANDGAIAIVVISGKPGLIKGLDEGIFVSAGGNGKGKNCVFVMSEARFRKFEPRV